MIYLIDTNIIREMCFHIPKKGLLFEGLWLALSECIESGEVFSVDECYNELEKQMSKDMEAMEWISEHKRMFLPPTNDESIFIGEMFKNPKFRESIHQKNILENRPSADAYLVAKARRLGATLATKEVAKQGSAQLPNLCEFYNIEVATYETFMEYIQSKIKI